MRSFRTATPTEHAAAAWRRPRSRALFGYPLLVLLLTAAVDRQAATLNRDGTKAFEEGRFEDASRLYSEALMQAPESESISYNLGAALHKTERFEDAAAAFARASRADDSSLRLKSFFSMGNTFFKMGELQKAVDAYKRALDVDPTDFATKVNLEKALELLEEQEQEQQQEQQQQQQNDQDQEGQKGEEESSGGDQQQQQQQQEGNEQESEQGDQQQQGDEEAEPSESGGEEQPSEEQQQTGAEQVAEGELRYEEALRILEAMRDQEKEQQKAKAQKLRARAKRGGKDW